jgi:single-strand DNA-binding protein
MAETASAHLERGQGVYIEGRLRIEEWTDRDNNKRYTLDVQAADMQFLPRSDAGNAAQSGGHAPAVHAAAGDDIPF